jgi:hypothetical protein
MACLLAALCLGLGDPVFALAEPVPNPLRVAKVWSGHPVGFSLLTRSNHQYVAYYDTDRQLIMAKWDPTFLACEYNSAQGLAIAAPKAANTRCVGKPCPTIATAPGRERCRRQAGLRSGKPTRNNPR